MINSKPILLLEDNKIEAMKVQRTFDKLGIEKTLHICQDGIEGMEWLEKNREDLPSVILLDLNMPRMNGLEFLAQIKQDESFKFIPVIVLTTSNNQKDKEESYRLSVAGYVVKPVEYGEYMNTMQKIKEYWEKCELPY